MAFDWEPYRDVIRSLYIVQDKNLHEVMRLVAEHHGIKKSRRQYEGVLKRWKFEKNTTADAWKAIHRKLDLRRRCGKNTAVYRVGKLVSAKKLRKETRHDFATAFERYATDTCPKTPEGFQVCTPAADGPPLVFMNNLPMVQLYDVLLDIGIRGYPGLLGVPSKNAYNSTVTRLTAYIHKRAGHLPAPCLIPRIVNLEEASAAVLGADWVQHRLCRGVLQLFQAAGCESRIIQQSVDPAQTSDLHRLVCLLAHAMSNNMLHKSEDMYWIGHLLRRDGKALVGELLKADSPAIKSLIRPVFAAAISLGYVDIVTMIITSGRDPNVPVNSSYERPLEIATKVGSIEMARVLLENGADPNLVDMWRRSCLLLAVEGNHLNLVQLLLSVGADPDAFVEWHVQVKSPLYRAVSKRNIEIVDALLEAGADVNRLRESEDTVLCLAVETNDLEMARCLLNRGACVYSRCKGSHGVVKMFPQRTAPGAAAYNGRGEMFLECTVLGAAACKGRGEMFRFLLQSEMSGCPHFGHDSANIALPEATLGGQKDVVDFILTYEISPQPRPASWPGHTALKVACSEGRLDIAELLISHGADVNSGPSKQFGLTALQAAAWRGHIDCVRYLVVHGAEINAPPFFNGFVVHDGRHNLTALQAASYGGHIEILRLLIYHGAEVNAPPAPVAGLTALQAAAKGGHSDCVLNLIAHGADINAKPSYFGGYTALQAAANTLHLEVLDLLLCYGADVNAPPCKNFVWTTSELRSDSTSGMRLQAELVRLLVQEFGADINAPGLGVLTTGRTLLHDAVKYRDIDMLRFLICHGADVNTYGYDGKTPLSSSMDAPLDVDIHALLLDAGARVDLLRPHDMFGPHDEHSVSRTQVIKNLLDLGLDANLSWLEEPSSDPFEGQGEDEEEDEEEEDDDDRHDKLSLLQQAACVWDAELVQILLDRGADVNLPAHNICGRTALQAAAECDRIQNVRVLLDHGADVNASPANKRGATALQAAAIRGNIEMVVLLLEKGADANGPAAVIGGRTALEGAAEHGRLDIVQLLLNVGAELQGTWAIDLAREEGHDGVVALLKSHQGHR